MLSDEFMEMMKNDDELQLLNRQVYAITGQLKDISFCSGASYTYEEWKEQLRQIVREHESTKQKGELS